jgi:hypothetical protein
MVLLAATAGAQVWKSKPIAQWSADDARQVLAESPWAKSVTPTLGPAQRVAASPGGIGIGGVGIGLPGGRRGSRGRGQEDTASADTGQVPTLTLRWVSSMPVSAAQLIVHELNSPAVDEDQYALAVYGVPSRMMKGDPEALGAELKKHATIVREGKKDMKPSAVDVLMHDDGAVVVYFFPRSNEIGRKDKLDFEAEIGRLKLSANFVASEMVFQGKLEL